MKYRRIVGHATDETSTGIVRHWDVLECGHRVPHREPRSTAEAIRYAFMEISGKPRRRACRHCSAAARQNDTA